MLMSKLDGENEENRVVSEMKGKIKILRMRLKKGETVSSSFSDCNRQARAAGHASVPVFQIEMEALKSLTRTDFDHLLHSFVDENQFPWLDPSLHER